MPNFPPTNIFFIKLFSTVPFYSIIEDRRLIREDTVSKTVPSATE